MELTVIYPFKYKLCTFIYIIRPFLKIAWTISSPILWFLHILKIQVVVVPRRKGFSIYLFQWMFVLLYYLLLHYFHCCFLLICIYVVFESGSFKVSFYMLHIGLSNIQLYVCFCDLCLCLVVDLWTIHFFFFFWCSVCSSELMYENILFIIFSIFKIRTCNWLVFLTLEIILTHLDFSKVQVPTGLVLW